MDVVLFVTFSLGLCVWLLLFFFLTPVGVFLLCVSPPNEYRKDVVLSVTFSLAFCLWLLLLVFLKPSSLYLCYVFSLPINFSRLEGGMGGRAQRLSPKRTQKGRRSFVLGVLVMLRSVATCWDNVSLFFTHEARIPSLPAR